MQRILDLRITRWQWKLLYVLGVLLAGWIVGGVVGAMGAPYLAQIIAGAITDVAGLLLGARIFRGRGEPVDPPRPWWQMTARPPLSRRLGILFLVLTVMSVATMFIAVFAPSAAAPAADVPVVIVALLEYAAIAWLYLNSAVRLGLPVPPREPKFRPKVRLKP
ncbi:hypothetical protein [Agromyces bauzanensis]|uniref:Uncharacterized protein n=1 Tax=Agromyces bauzanensis TaxID=1308924 RepID=A0A917US89_9MICO|nr:hypothetical protein [Agromyces bauzanensis]GGJ82123.1 hypothetical protein GCM10011372_20680 [Agromyces bauzanensis]